MTTKATAQMGGLTREEIEEWRKKICSKIFFDFSEDRQHRELLEGKFNALCDLALQGLDRWVPVSERLPSGDDPVLTLSVNAHMTTKPAMAMRNSIVESIKHGRVPHYTHWMPLPPPPPERP